MNLTRPRRDELPAGASAIGIYGAGGMGRDVVFVLDSRAAGAMDGVVVGFIDDSVMDQTTEPCSGLPRWPFHQFVTLFPHAMVIPAIADPAGRRVTTERARAAGLRVTSAIDARAHIGKRVVIGEGTVICAGTVIPGDVVIGAGVLINACCTVGHDSILGDYATLSPGVRLSGNVTIGADVLVGTSAVITPGVSIGQGATIAAGSVVTRDVPSGASAAGVPARALRPRLERLMD